MKKSFLMFLTAFITIAASCQDDKTFNREIKANAGITTTFLKFSDGTMMTTANVGSTTWESITGKPDFDLLYKPIGYVPTWAEITSKPTFATVATSGLFIDLLSKPTTIAGYGITNAMTTSHPANGITTTSITNWNTAFGWGNHSGLYRPIGWAPTWNDVTGKPTTFVPTAHTHDYNTDITNKPPEKDLMEAILDLDYLPVPSKTTAEINALVMPAGSAAIVKDATLGVYKVYKDGEWSIIITSN